MGVQETWSVLQMEQNGNLNIRIGSVPMVLLMQIVIRMGYKYIVDHTQHLVNNQMPSHINVIVG